MRLIICEASYRIVYASVKFDHLSRLFTPVLGFLDKMTLDGSAKSDAESEIDDLQEDEDFQDQVHISAEHDEVKVQFDKDIDRMNQLLSRHAASTNKSDKLQQQRAEQKAFIDDRESWWKDLGRLTSDNRNFLHHLAYCGRKTGKDTSRLIAKIILRLVGTKAMGMLDSSKRAALTVAIHENNWAFVNAACISVRPDDRKQMGKHLVLECQSAKDTPDQKGLTCLQSAILNLSPGMENQAQSILNMVDFVPEDMFTITDAMGRTPLHLAIEYNRGIAKQPEIVEKLLIRGPKALKLKVIDQYSASSFTVCKYLVPPASSATTFQSHFRCQAQTHNLQINITRRHGETRKPEISRIRCLHLKGTLHRPRRGTKRALSLGKTDLTQKRQTKQVQRKAT